MDWNNIHSLIQEKSLLKHPFYLAWSAGELTLKNLRDYAKQYYVLESTIPALLASMLSQCHFYKMQHTYPHCASETMQSIQQMILGNLNDELGGKQNHLRLWSDFAVKGLGLTEEEMRCAPIYSNTTKCIEGLTALCSELDTGMAAFYAYESQIPGISESKISGLKKYYGIEAADAIQFFVVHQIMDTWHAEQEKNSLIRLETPLQKIYNAVEQSCDALWSFLDGICSYSHCGMCPTLN